MRKAKGKRRRILVLDVGGSHVKMRLGTRGPIREFKSGPKLRAKDMVAQVLQLTADWPHDAVTVGYPGVVCHGRIAADPHNLGPGWVGFDFRAAFGKPTRVINDAALQAIGSYRGGRMLFLGLGTGLGSALIADDVLLPAELAHLPYKNGRTYEDYLGVRGLERLGKKKWRQHVADVVEKLSAALECDYVVLGGGNAKELNELPPKARLGNNANAFRGGVRLWSKTFSQPAARSKSDIVPT